MFLKIMSDEDLPDDDPRKSYTLIEKVEEVRFARESRGGGAFVDFTDARGARESRSLHGNAYVINDIGHEIDAFGVASPYSPGEDDEPEPESWPFGPSGGPIPGESESVFAGYCNLDAEPHLAMKPETDYTEGLAKEKFELLRIPDSDDVVIRHRITGEGAVLAGEGSLSADDDAQGPVATFEVLEGCYSLMEQTFNAVKDAGLIVPKEALDNRLDGGRAKRQAQLDTYVKSIRGAVNDEPVIYEVLDRTTEAHMDSLIAAAAFCAYAAREARDPDTGTAKDPGLVPDTVKATGQPDRFGKARLFELRSLLDEYLKVSDRITVKSLAASALRLYAWKDKVRVTNKMGNESMEELCRVCEAVLTA